MAENEGRARTGHLKRHLQGRRYITCLGGLGAATSKKIVQLLVSGGASGGRTADAAAAAAAAKCRMKRLELERGKAAARTPPPKPLGKQRPRAA